ncbi:hypothetical protein [Micromonospora thermarum]|uniref:Uncharacterized protein n=1 Tax=Micromonospora thermarum TaxID=2720024 RepID=A0ABX0Z5B2_9ACTN|nr:hypothetical protein [Micromonospora thermarum]NJP33040.1 hypothetical protein [Micromonospora thermarum]
MRQDEQQATDHPEAVRSAPVPVPPPGDRAGTADTGGKADTADRADVPEDALDDRGTFDDPRVAGDRDTGDRDRDRRADAEGRPEFHEPGPVPTAFGATTVGGAVAASALASGRPEDEPDPRTESTARPGDGAEGGEREGWRADPTAEFRGGPGWEERRERAAAFDGDETTGTATVVPPGATEGRPERRADLTTWGGDPDAAAAGAAGYGSATPSMVDPDSVSPDADPALAGARTDIDAARAGANGSLEAAGTARPAGSTVAAEPATLFETGVAQGFRDRWRDVQLRFVDDPRAAAGEAQALVDEAIQALASALSAQKQKLGAWQSAGSADTEQLRVAVRRYRDFLDRVLGR